MKFSKTDALKWVNKKAISKIKRKGSSKQDLFPKREQNLPTRTVVKGHRRTTSNSYVLHNQDSSILPSEYQVWGRGGVQDDYWNSQLWILGEAVLGCLAECVEGETMEDWKRKPGLDEPQYFHLENKKTIWTPRVIEIIAYKVDSSDLELQGCELTSPFSDSWNCTTTKDIL